MMIATNIRGLFYASNQMLDTFNLLVELTLFLLVLFYAHFGFKNHHLLGIQATYFESQIKWFWKTRDGCCISLDNDQ